MLKRTLSAMVAVGAAVIAIGGCGSAPTGPSQPSAPIVATPPAIVAPSPSTAVAPSTASGPRLAPRDPALEQWKRQVAEHIHAVNSKQLFEGRPHHLLQGVIVADLTVDRNGQVTRSRIVRSPGIAKLNSAVLASLKTAAPLPAPPAALVKAGPVTYSETWLFTNDSRWRLRTLTLPQE